MKKIFLAVVLFVSFPVLALDVELEAKVYGRFVACFSDHAAIDIADTYVQQGAEASDKLILSYQQKRLCENKETSVTFTNDIHHAEGKHGSMDVLRGTADGTTIFAPLGWAPVGVCDPKEGNACA